MWDLQVGVGLFMSVLSCGWHCLGESAVCLHYSECLHCYESFGLCLKFTSTLVFRWQFGIYTFRDLPACFEDRFLGSLLLAFAVAMAVGAIPPSDGCKNRAPRMFMHAHAASEFPPPHSCSPLRVPSSLLLICIVSCRLWILLHTRLWGWKTKSYTM